MGQVRAAVDAGRIMQPVTVVLEGKARAGADSGLEGGVTVAHAPRSGDDLLVELVADTQDESVTVVTADRELRRRAEALGAEVEGPSWLIRRIES